MAKKEIAEKKNTNVAMPDFDFSESVGAGMEGTDKESFAIPFLSVLQALSPELDESDGKYIEGAKAGEFLNTVTLETFEGKENGVVFLPCAYQRRFIHWGPRGSEGGFKGELLPEEAAELEAQGKVIREGGKLYFPLDDGKIDEKKCEYLSDTRNHFGLLVDEETGTAAQVLLSLSSTQIKKSKQLMSLLAQAKVKGPNGDMVTPPTWMNKIRLTTVKESNDHGSWYGIKITPQQFITDKNLYHAGKEFFDLIRAGEAKVDYKAASETKESDGSF